MPVPSTRNVVCKRENHRTFRGIFARLFVLGGNAAVAGQPHASARKAWQVYHTDSPIRHDQRCDFGLPTYSVRSIWFDLMPLVQGRRLPLPDELQASGGAQSSNQAFPPEIRPAFSEWTRVMFSARCTVLVLLNLNHVRSLSSGSDKVAQDSLLS